MLDVYVHINGDTSEELRLTTAIHLAARFDGRVCCVQISPEPRLVSMDSFGGTYVTPELALLRQELDERERQRVEAWLASHGAVSVWKQVFGEAGPALVRATRFADLVVLSAGPSLARHGERPASVAPHFLAHGRLPALLLPEKAGFTAGGVIAIAWDGSEQAAAALRGAYPLLDSATRIHLLSVGDEAQASLDEAMDFLTVRGIEPSVERLGHPVGVLTSAILRDAAFRHGADLLVMGAFGHGRTREFIFGGVTEAFLEEMPLPLLICH